MSFVVFLRLVSVTFHYPRYYDRDWTIVRDTNPPFRQEYLTFKYIYWHQIFLWTEDLICYYEWII